MKHRIQKRLVFIMFLISAIFLAVASLMSICTFEHFKYVKVLENGYETVATVTDQTTSNVSIDEMVYGRAILTYTDENGQEQQGSTSLCYLASAIPSVGSTINIKVYNGDTVESNYVLANPYIVCMILTFTFGGIALVLLIIGLINLSIIVRDNNVVKNGRKSTGTFVDYNPGAVINTRPLYSIEFSFRSSYNQLKTLKSSSNYYKEEVEKLMAIKEFEIYVDEDRAVITQNLDNVNLEELLSTLKTQRKFCSHCGKENEKDTLNCVSCGASLKGK